MKFAQPWILDNVWLTRARIFKVGDEAPSGRTSESWPLLNHNSDHIAYYLMFLYVLNIYI